MAVTLLPCQHLSRKYIFLSGRKLGINLKALALTCDYSNIRGPTNRLV